MSITPCCPQTSYLVSAATVLNPCPQDTGQIQKAIFWRAGNSTSVASALIATTWNTLLIATDDTRAIVTPFIQHFQLPIGEAREHPDTRDGATLRKANKSTKINKKFTAEGQDVIKNLKYLRCEALEVIFVNEANQLIYSDREGDFRGFPVIPGSMFIGDKRIGGFSDWDSNKMIFNLEPGWSNSLEISESTTFSMNLPDFRGYSNEPVVIGDKTAYLSVSNAALRLVTPIEIEFWYYYADTQNWLGAVGLVEVNNDSDNYLAARIENNSTTFGLYGESAGVSAGFSELNFFNTVPGWYKIKITWDGTAMKTYRNDILVITQTTIDANNLVAAGAELRAMDNVTGGTKSVPAGHKLFGLKYTTNGTLIARYPVCEESGNTVYNVVSNAYHLTGQSGFSGLTWSRDNDQDKYLRDYGYRLASGVYIPALLDESSAADGNALTNVSPNTEFN